MIRPSHRSSAAAAIPNLQADRERESQAGQRVSPKPAQTGRRVTSTHRSAIIHRRFAVKGAGNRTKKGDRVTRSPSSVSRIPRGGDGAAAVSAISTLGWAGGQCPLRGSRKSLSSAHEAVRGRTAVTATKCRADGSAAGPRCTRPSATHHPHRSRARNPTKGDLRSRFPYPQRDSNPRYRRERPAS